MAMKESPPLKDTYAPKEVDMPLKESPRPLKDTYARKEVAISSDILVNAENLHLSHVEDIHNLKSELTNLEVKLEEAEILIIKLREETRSSIWERDKLRHEVVFLKRKGSPPSQAGFPLLFVAYMVILAVSLGYLLHL